MSPPGELCPHQESHVPTRGAVSPAGEQCPHQEDPRPHQQSGGPTRRAVDLPGEQCPHQKSTRRAVPPSWRGLRGAPETFIRGAKPGELHGCPDFPYGQGFAFKERCSFLPSQVKILTLHILSAPPLLSPFLLFSSQHQLLPPQSAVEACAEGTETLVPGHRGGSAANTSGSAWATPVSPKSRGWARWGLGGGIGCCPLTLILPRS